MSTANPPAHLLLGLLSCDPSEMREAQRRLAIWDREHDLELHAAKEKRDAEERAILRRHWDQRREAERAAKGM